MKIKASALAVLLLLSILSLSGTLFDNTTSGNSNPDLDWDGVKPLYYNISVVSPEQQVFIKDNESVALKFIGQSNNNLAKNAYCFTFDSSGELLMGPIWDSFLKVNEDISKTTISNDSLAPDKPYNSYVQVTTECTATLLPLSNGLHNITIYHGNSYNFKWNIYSNLTTFYFTVFEPLNISILSPQNKTFNSNIVPLHFSSNRQIEWSGYSLDGKENVTVTGNITLNGLSSGSHNITIYANDTHGNMCASEIFDFNIAKSEPFPTVTIAAVSVVIALIAVAGLLVYFKKHKR